MDQLADLLRARASGAGGGGGVRALLACLDEAGSGSTANAANTANAETATTTSFGVDVAIHGPGAAGSTHLANFLHREAGLRCNLLVDPDGSRHAPWPPPPPSSPPSSSSSAPAPPPPPPCLIYLYSDDPLLGVASFFRRGIAAEQALKTTGAAALASAPAGVDQQTTKQRARAALRLAGGFPQTFDAFLERGEDLFGLEAHLEGWLTLPAATDVLFLRYEGAFEERVARALFSRLLNAARARRWRDEGDDGGNGGTEAEAERLAREWCAQRRDRRTQLTDEQRSRGERLFASYSSRFAALPSGGCFVRPADPVAAASRSMDEWEAL
jgi:hypothetical protein